jgi:hypothetical protein
MTSAELMLSRNDSDAVAAALPPPSVSDDDEAPRSAVDVLPATATTTTTMMMMQQRLDADDDAQQLRQERVRVELMQLKSAYMSEELKQRQTQLNMKYCDLEYRMLDLDGDELIRNPRGLDNLSTLSATTHEPLLHSQLLARLVQAVERLASGSSTIGSGSSDPATDSLSIHADSAATTALPELMIDAGSDGDGGVDDKSPKHEARAGAVEPVPVSIAARPLLGPSATGATKTPASHIHFSSDDPSPRSTPIASEKCHRSAEPGDWKTAGSKKRFKSGDEKKKPQKEIDAKKRAAASAQEPANGKKQKKQKAAPLLGTRN